MFGKLPDELNIFSQYLHLKGFLSSVRSFFFLFFFLFFFFFPFFFFFFWAAQGGGGCNPPNPPSRSASDIRYCSSIILAVDGLNIHLRARKIVKICDVAVRKITTYKEENPNPDGVISTFLNGRLKRPLISYIIITSISTSERSERALWVIALSRLKLGRMRGKGDTYRKGALMKKG